MLENTADLENNLQEQAVLWLRSHLPDNWKVEPSARADLKGPHGRVDGAIDLTGQNMYVTLVVEARRRFAPRDVERLVTGAIRTMQTLGRYPILVVAPWLSPRTQVVLREHGINYLDLTGNALVRIDSPTLYIETQGSTKDPSPLQRNEVRLRGSKAGRIIRLLADSTPPYGVRDLADAAGLAPSYVSRVIEVLDNEAILERTSSGGVGSVDIRALIRRWVTTYGVFRNNRRESYLAPQGAQTALWQLAESGRRSAVTGSFAAYREVSVAVPSMLVAYVEDPKPFERELSWIGTGEGANVVLLVPFDPVIWANTWEEKGIRYASPSQVAADCLTGNGRMPQEGEAFLDWMLEHQAVWRRDGLQGFEFS